MYLCCVAMKQEQPKLGLATIPGHAWRKLVLRRVTMGCHGVQAGTSVGPSPGAGTSVEFLRPDSFGEVLGTNPNLREIDIERFAEQNATCIVARIDGAVAASSWMTYGEVYVSDLGRTIHVADDEHYSCRSYVDPRWRGQSLFGVMVQAYTAAQRPQDLVWGHVFDWNTASIHTLEKLGWRRFGDSRTTFVFTRPVASETRYPPRPATTLK